MKWAQTLDYPDVNGVWERMRVVRCSNCSWDPPVLGWAAREAAVEAYCGALQRAARQRLAAARGTPLPAAPRPSHDGRQLRSAARQPDAAAAARSPPKECCPNTGTAAQQAMLRNNRRPNSLAAEATQPLSSPQQGKQASDVGAASMAAGTEGEQLPARPGFEGLSLCLFRRMPKSEAVFRRG